MKKLLYFTFVLALVTSACKKSEDAIVDPSNNNNNNNNTTDTTSTQKPPFISGTWNTINGDTNFYSVDRAVRCFGIYNNDLYIGGDFSNILDFKNWNGSNYGLPAITTLTKGIVKWNKTSSFVKMPFETTLNSPIVKSMLVKDNLLYFLGNAIPVNGSPSKGMFSWDGSAVTNYNPLNTISTNIGFDDYWNIVEFKNKIYIPSYYSSHLLVSLDGNTWGKEGGIPPKTQSNMLLCVYKDALYVAFGYEAILYKYDGTIITKVMEAKADNVNGEFHSMYVYNNELYVGGWFYSIETASKSNTAANSIVKFNGTSWLPLANGMKDGKVKAMCEWDNKLIIGGINLVKVNNDFSVGNIVAWDGSKYLSIGEPKSKTEGNGVNGDVSALISYKSELFIGGNFGRITDKTGNSKNAYCLARFTKQTK